MIESIPKELTLPDQAAYPPSELFLFGRHNRATWAAEHDEQAAVWDKQRRIKRWADTSFLTDGLPEDQMVRYDYFDRPSRTFKEFKLSVLQASLPNLPGVYVYQKDLVFPTAAVVVGPDGDEQSLNPNIICYKEEAEVVAAELGGHVIGSTSFSEGPFTIDWKGEVRRRWLIVFPHTTCNAAMLLRARNSAGVDAPGQWAWSKAEGHGEPRWLSHQEETGDQDPRPEIPVPCRLPFDEEAIWVGFGGTTMIYRKDMESPYNPAPQADGGGMTAGQAQQLTEIHRDVAAIAERLGID